MLVLQVDVRVQVNCVILYLDADDSGFRKCYTTTPTLHQRKGEIEKQVGESKEIKERVILKKKKELERQISVL